MQVPVRWVVWGLLGTGAPSLLSTPLLGPPHTTSGPPRAATTIGSGFQSLDVGAFNDVLRSAALPGMGEVLFSTPGIGEWSRAPGQKMAVAFRTGYADALMNTSWRADHNDHSSGPRAAYGGIYARLGISIGVARRKATILPALVSALPWIARQGWRRWPWNGMLFSARPP